VLREGDCDDCEYDEYEYGALLPICLTSLLPFRSDLIICRGMSNLGIAQADAVVAIIGRTSRIIAAAIVARQK
jgi:hypothetical protein